jgi:hypothetical protein
MTPAMSKQSTPPTEQNASRVALVGIIAGLVLTSAGMLMRSPVLGGVGLVALAILVIFRRPIAGLVTRS